MSAKSRPFANRFVKNRLFVAGSATVCFFLFIAVFAPFVAPSEPTAMLFEPFMPPDAAHWMGTDEHGRDVLSRVIYGARVSMFVGLVSVGVSVLIGTAVGLAAGYYGRIVDAMLMRFTDVMLSFPSFFLILAVVAFLQPSLFNVMLVIGLTGWMGVARLVRAEVLSIRTLDFVVAANVGGVGSLKILYKHILPNVASVITVSATLGVAGAILTESSLSFLGLGTQPPTPSWGNILTVGKDNILFAWWLSFFPGVAILLAVLGFNLLGEGLKEVLSGK